MEDGMISAGVMLSLIVDRYAVTKDDALRERALDVFKGMRLCATAHGVPGFLARAVCAKDLDNPSRHFEIQLRLALGSPVSGNEKPAVAFSSRLREDDLETCLEADYRADI
jgi:hypothetical protein